MEEIMELDSFERMIQSQNRLRETVNPNITALFRLEKYTKRTSEAFAGIGTIEIGKATTVNQPMGIQAADNAIVDAIADSTNSIVAAIGSSLSSLAARLAWLAMMMVEKLTEQSALDTLSKLAALPSGVNDTAEVLNKIKGLFGKGKGAGDAAQRVICVCECCSGKVPPGPNNGTGGTSDSGKLPQGNNGKEPVSRSGGLPNRPFPSEKLPKNARRMGNERFILNRKQTGSNYIANKENNGVVNHSGSCKPDKKSWSDKISGRKGSGVAQRLVCVCQCCSENKGLRSGGYQDTPAASDKLPKKARRFGKTKYQIPYKRNPSDPVIPDHTNGADKGGHSKPPTQRTGNKPIQDGLESDKKSIYDRMHERAQQLNSSTSPKIPELPEPLPHNNLDEKTRSAATSSTSSGNQQDSGSNADSTGENRRRRFTSGKRPYNPTIPPAPDVPVNPTTSSREGTFTSKGNNGLIQHAGGLLDFGKKGLDLIKVAGKANAAISVASGIMSIATAENKPAAAVEAAAGAGGAALGSIIGTMLLPGVGTVVGGMAGAWLGEKAGKFLGNKWFGKKENEEEIEKSKEAGDSHGFPRATQFAQRFKQNTVDVFPTTAVALSHPQLSLYTQSNQQPQNSNTEKFDDKAVDSNVVTTSPTYNISVEGVQVVMPKEEIDEESLARRIGWDIVNKIKASMDNQVVTG